MQQNPYLDFLNEQPRGTYFSYRDQWGDSPKQQGYYQNRFEDLHNEYLASLAKQARAGFMPSGSWNDFLGGGESGQPFDFSKWYREQNTYQQRNPDASVFQPRVQWRV